MNKTRVLNMTSGNPSRLLAIFALPMLIGNLFQQAYNLVDSIVVGQFVGASALAAVGATGSVTFMFFSICGGIGAGCGIVTSQCFGAGDTTITKQAICNSAYVMFTASLLMGIIAFIAAPSVLRLMDTPADIMPDAVLYMRISCVGVPLVAVYNFTSSMLRALGDSRTPLYFLIFASFANIVLDLICVCLLHMGVMGVALATIAAQLMAGVGCLIYVLKTNSYFRIARSERAPSREMIKSSVRLGIPLAFQWSLIAISTAGLQAFVNSFGTAAVAAFTATSRVEQLVHQPYGSLSTALSTYAGQNFGAKRLDRVRSGLRHGMAISAVLSVIMIVVMQLFAENIISLFVDDAEVIRLGAHGLRFTSLFYIFLATINMTRGLLNGVGDALFSLINGIVEVICRIGLPMLIVLIPGMGLNGIWWTAGLAWVISSAFCVMRYTLWKRKTREI
ncbi:MAG: MATE family efflux transporter [Clostridia bacterium]|nr:MATE family efflux transporter [Clostridia bacterium]